jgi:hypothetical protein
MAPAAARQFSPKEGRGGYSSEPCAFLCPTRSLLLLFVKKKKQKKIKKITPYALRPTEGKINKGSFNKGAGFPLFLCAKRALKRALKREKEAAGQLRRQPAVVCF